jgi:hypothetical protein
MKVNLANLQVVIFSRNRHEHLAKSLRYWDNLGIATLVLHNTEQPIKSAEIPSSTEYIVHAGPFAERCEIASKVLKFKFFIIASDDERYLPTALTNMVKELEENQELASVGGQAVAVMTHGLKYSTTLAYKSQMNYENLDNNPERRFEFHYESGQNFSGAMYRVFRREQFKNFLVVISQFSDISTPYIFEVTAELFWTLIGPSKYLNEVFWVRNWVVPPIQTGDWDRKQYFYEWSQNPEHAREFESWKEMITEIFDFLKNRSNIYEKIIFHRMKTEQGEQSRNQVLKKQKHLKVKRIARALTSIFSSKYRMKELESQLSNFGVAVRNDELFTALISITG